MTASYVGIDLGTSAVKVIVQDAEGRALAKASRPYPTRAPQPGWAEQSPDDWWAATCAALAEALAAAGAGSGSVEVRSVGLSGQLNGFVLLSEAEAPLLPAIIWLDLRAEAETAEIGAAVDVPALSGNALNTICVLPKLAWLRRHRPEVMARVRRVLFVKDWLLWRLTGAVATDPSDAASSAATVPDGHAWEPRLLALAGMEEAVMPPIRLSASVGGCVTPAAAAATGLPVGTPVAVGAGDVTALAVGCGVVVPGRVTITLGTAGHVVAEGDGGADLGALGLWRLPHAVPGRGLLLGLVMSGGLSLAWLRKVLGMGGEGPAFDELERLAAGVPDGARGVTFVPFLEGSATPHRRADARGAFLGLSSSHGAPEMVRAVMEGVAFAAADCIAALEAAGTEVREVRLAEGGAQSALWCAILAAAIGRPVALVAERDTSAAGAALLGRAAVEGEGAALPHLADAACRLARRFDPPADRSGIEAAQARYRSAVARLLA